MALKKIKKLYYSIGDVSELTDLKQYVLRYWETEFSFLNPNKNSAGNRIYKDKDIRIIKEIQNLLYDRKFTIKGAKQFLKTKYNSKIEIDNIVSISDNNSSTDHELLMNLKKGLEDIVSIINKHKT